MQKINMQFDIRVFTLTAPLPGEGSTLLSTMEELK
jgi:hypothetical protein